MSVARTSRTPRTPRTPGSPGITWGGDNPGGAAPGVQGDDQRYESNCLLMPSMPCLSYCGLEGGTGASPRRSFTAIIDAVNTHYLDHFYYLALYIALLDCFAVLDKIPN